MMTMHCSLYERKPLPSHPGEEPSDQLRLRPPLPGGCVVARLLVHVEVKVEGLAKVSLEVVHVPVDES